MTVLEKEKVQALAELESTAYATKRVTVPSLEEILYKPLPVLDHGFLRVIDYMGNDSSIVQAARVSYGSGTKQVNKDKGLIYYLMRHRHTTPFEMCDIKFHVKLPIFIARQWIRHRTASVNEYSARYSILGSDFYLPSPEHLAVQSNANRQGRGDKLTPDEAKRVLSLLEDDAKLCYEHYQDMLNEDKNGEVISAEKTGLSRELARMNLTLNYYTEWYWKINLHNLLHFVRLRADSHAQYEIRVYAEVMLDIVKKWVPLTYGAFEEYSLSGANFSKKGLHCLKQMINGNKVTHETSGMSKREWQEFCGKLDL